MAGFLGENTRPAFLSIALHGLIAAALLFAADFSFHRAHLDVQMPIDATIVDSRIVRAATAARQQAAESARAAALQRQQAERLRQQQLQQQLQQQQHAAEQAAQKVRAQAAAKAQAEAAAAAEAKREAAEQAAAKRAAAQQAAVQQAAAKRAAAREAEAEAEAEARREAQAKRAAEAAAAAKKAAEAKRLADARAARQADLQRQIAAEEHADEVARGPLADQYRAALQNRIIQAWIKPPTARPGIDCLVEVTQIPGGTVTNAQVTQCNGDAAVRQSIENAIVRASPLPAPPDPALFHRTFVFEFKPDE